MGPWLVDRHGRLTAKRWENRGGEEALLTKLDEVIAIERNAGAGASELARGAYQHLSPTSTPIAFTFVDARLDLRANVGK